MPSLKKVYVDIRKSPLFQPLQLIKQATGMVDIIRVQVSVGIPAFLLEEIQSSCGTFQPQRAVPYNIIPCIRRHISTNTRSWLNHVCDDESTSVSEHGVHILEQHLFTP